MSGGYGLVSISGSVLSSISSSLELSGNLNVRSYGQRKLYRQLISGELTIAQAAQTAPSGISTAAPAFAPSWTQYYAGKRHGHVTPALSSSHHALALNAYFSGNVGLERTQIPASGAMYYSKQSRYLYKVYKLSASANLPAIPLGCTGSSVPAGGFFNAVSGSFRVSYASPPFIDCSYFQIEVPDRGRIVDIKVWVELIHKDRTYPGVSGSIFGDYLLGRLTNTVISLAPPISSFSYGVPLWNDNKIKNYIESTSGWSDVYKRSYILWNGYGQRSFLNIMTDWNTDMDMRTIFSDSAQIDSNPNILNVLYNGNFFSSSLYTLMKGPLSASAPNTVGLQRYGSTRSYTPSATGNLYPWFVDTRIPLGNMSYAASSSYTSSVIMPGWLSSASSGVPAPGVNEFNTSPLENLGPYYTKPAFPLLDDVYHEQISVGEFYPGQYDGYGYPSEQPKFVGFRPGLRNQQANGVWTLIVKSYFDYWFRQFRLEMIIDQGEEISKNPQSIRKNKKTAIVPIRNYGKKHILQIVSGTSDFDMGTSIVYSLPQEQGVGFGYGRTVGITDNTSSFSDFAVFTRLTGALADRLFLSSSITGSGGTAGALYAYLNNQFKTPYIPLSSGSSISTTFIRNGNVEDPTARKIVDDTLSRRPLVSSAQRIKDVMSRLPLTGKRIQDVLTKSTGSV